MELISLEKREILLDTLQQIRQSCENLMSWNKDVKDMKVLLNSSTGMQDLAGNCMTVMAIEEGFRKIDKITDGKFLILRPEIPWNQVFGLRNRIAHGYFDIDVDVISDVVNNDLQPLLEAIDYFVEYLKNKD